MARRSMNVLMFVGALVFPAILFASDPDSLLGIWDNQEKSARIEIVKCGERYCGKIVELKEPNYPDGSTEGAPGSPKMDTHNPDPRKRNAPVLGLLIVNDMRFDGPGRWSGGTVYDPKNGRTYKGKMTLVARDQLELRGYIGISLIGRTTTWTR